MASVTKQHMIWAANYVGAITNQRMRLALRWGFSCFFNQYNRRFDQSKFDAAINEKVAQVRAEIKKFKAEIKARHRAEAYSNDRYRNRSD